jgi:glutamyl-Q tRNA(Asp) synthetase
LAALASYLDARSQHGEWMVRMEDIDPPRNIPGASDHIMRTLETIGFEWDGEFLQQSDRYSFYSNYRQLLIDNNNLYLCNCSRKSLAKNAPRGPEGVVYPGTCRPHQRTENGGAWRIPIGSGIARFIDLIQGEVTRDRAAEIGDFIVWRRDGLVAYQLAVTVDDALQGITHVVRGSDLLGVTPRQIHLQKLLNLAPLQYAHHPVATHADGSKLSKQTAAKALQSDQLGVAVWEALRFLGQTVPNELRGASSRELLGWGRTHWQLAKVPKVAAMQAPKCYVE